MKYLVYIFVIACLATISFLYSPGSVPDVRDCAVRIDGRIISSQEIETLKEQSPSLFAHADALPESLIMREVLISEALRQKVDKEEVFRQRIKTFYEQSLVKILVERKMDSIRYTPKNEEVAAYTNLLGCSVAVDRVPLDVKGQQISGEVEHLSGSFLDFSVAIRMTILLLKIGDVSKPVHLFDQDYVVILKNISEKDPLFSDYNKARDLAVIKDYRRQEIFMLWQESLMKHAEIEIVPKQEEQGR